jgi:antitoxin component YwqK of YwqJK toxin-antitoxin module
MKYSIPLLIMACLLGGCGLGKSGTEIKYYENGSKEQEFPYENEKIHGTEIRYYENGSKRSETVYKKGKAMAATAWKPNGGKCPETTLIDGDGVLMLYYEDGRKQSETVYENGKEISSDYSF